MEVPLTHSFIALFTLLAFLGGATSLPKPFRVAQDYGSGIPMLNVSPVVAAAGAMTSIILGSSRFQCANTAVDRFLPVSGMARADFTATQADTLSIVAVAGDIDQLRVQLDGDIGTLNDDITITLQRNGSDSDPLVECTVFGTSGSDDKTCEELTLSEHYDVGDTIGMRIETFQTPISVRVQWGLRFIATSGDVQPLMASHGRISGNTSFEVGLTGSSDTQGTGHTHAVIATAGSITRMHASAKTALSGAKTIVVTVAEDSVLGGCTCTLSSSNNPCTPITCSDTFDIGDEITLVLKGSGNPAANHVSVGLEWDPTTTGESLILGTTGTRNFGDCDGSTRYVPPSQDLSESVDNRAARSQVVPVAFTMKNMRVAVATAPGTGETYDYTLDRNGSVTAQVCPMAGTDPTCDDGDDVAISAADVISIKCEASVGATVPGKAGWGFSLTVP